MRRRLVLGTAILMMIAMASVCRPVPERPGTAGPTAADVPSGNPDADHAHAVELQRAGEHFESLPFFNAAVLAASQRSELHLDYAMALHNASIETDTSCGSVRFVVRRGEERARLRAEAFRELTRAAELAPGSDELAYVLMVRARILDIMGLSLDARECVTQALALRPDEPILRNPAIALDRRIHP